MFAFVEPTSFSFLARKLKVCFSDWIMKHRHHFPAANTRDFTDRVVTLVSSSVGSPDFQGDQRCGLSNGHGGSETPPSVPQISRQHNCTAMMGKMLRLHPERPSSFRLSSPFIHYV